MFFFYLCTRNLKTLNVMGKNSIYSFSGCYRENYVDGTDVLHAGTYDIVIFKTRCKVSFTPAESKDPLFFSFVILGNLDKTLAYINRNWQ